MRIRVLASFTQRLVATTVIVALISATTATALAYRQSRNAMLERAQDLFMSDFRARTEDLSADLDVPATRAALMSFAEKLSDSLAGRANVSAQFRDVSVTYGPGRAASALITPELSAAVKTGRRLQFQRVVAQGLPVLVVGSPILYTNGKNSGVAVFAVTSLETERDNIAAVLTAARNGTIPVLFLAVLLAFVAARTVLRPVRELGRATRRLAAGDLTARAEVTGHDELARLAEDFNDTAAELEASIQELRRQEAQARRFVADVSHELRTPLAAISLVTSVLDEEADSLPPDAAQAARMVSGETGKLVRLVEDLMEISRFDARAATLSVSTFDVGAQIRQTLSLRGWDGIIGTELPDGVLIEADRARLDVIVANLVGNAVRHGEPPVTLTLTEEATGIRLEVLDDGPGMTPEVAGQVFERFYKADPSRARSDGSGLGAAIALENAHLHGGSIAIEPQPSGTLVVLSLPRRPRLGTGR